MGLHSGKFAVVNGVDTVRDWNVDDKMTPAKYIASNTKGGTGRAKGNQDWSGNYFQYGGVPAIMPGEPVVFIGYTAPTDDVSGVGGKWFGPAIVDSVVITWNWGSGELLSVVTNFSGTGVLAVSTGTYSDATTPTPLSVIGTKVSYDVAAADTEWTNLVQAVLTISCANQAYVNSSTAGWNGRKAGPIDWTLAITEQDDVVSAQRAKDTNLDLRLWINATDYWKLKWGKIREYTGLKVDRQGNIIQRTCNLDMNGPGGYIRKPAAGADWWTG